MEIFVIKRKGHQEQFDEKKVYASVYTSASNCHFTEQESEKISEELTKKIILWLKQNPTVEAHSLKLRVIKELKELNKDVAKMYEIHTNLN